MTLNQFLTKFDENKYLGQLLSEMFDSLRVSFLTMATNWVPDILNWAGVTYLRYTVLTIPKGETAVYCCDPALSVFVLMLVSRNVFYVLSALQSIANIKGFSGHLWRCILIFANDAPSV